VGLSFINKEVYRIVVKNLKSEANKFEGKVILGDPYTILIDGERKTVVKAFEETYNPQKGVVIALLNHLGIASSAKLKYLLQEMGKGDPELVLGKYLLKLEGIDGQFIQKLVNNAQVEKKNSNVSREDKKVDTKLFEPTIPVFMSTSVRSDDTNYVKQLNERMKESEDNNKPLTEKLFGKKYSELTQEELRQYRRHLSNLKKPK